MGNLLQATDLVCGYHGQAITAPLNLTLDAGKVISLIGPNGSGKSTLLKTVSAELPALSGGVSVLGGHLRGLGPAQVAQKLAVVPQDESYAFRFTVWQIVAMGRLARSQGFFETPEDDQAIRAALEATDCAPFAQRSILEISGGERQRVMIARAVAQETPVLIMDEPTSHLDVAHIADFVAIIRRLAAEGKGIILAVHDINVALAVADEILLLHKGQCRFQGSAADLAHGEEAEAVYGLRFVRIENQGRITLVPQYI
jgi:iron complex transport system ATP-binding protein